MYVLIISLLSVLLWFWHKPQQQKECIRSFVLKINANLHKYCRLCLPPSPKLSACWLWECMWGLFSSAQIYNKVGVPVRYCMHACMQLTRDTRAPHRISQEVPHHNKTQASCDRFRLYVEAWVLAKKRPACLCIRGTTSVDTTRKSRYGSWSRDKCMTSPSSKRRYAIRLCGLALETRPFLNLKHTCLLSKF